VALTAVAMAHDANDPHFREGNEEAHAEAKRSRELAKAGVPPAGGLAVYENDPAFAAKALFSEHCKSCHELDGVGGEEAPRLSAFATREWLVGAVREPRSKAYFGGTEEHEMMEAYGRDDLSDENLRAVVEYLVELRGDSTPTDASLASK